jgi:hypothetical protein
MPADRVNRTVDRHPQDGDGVAGPQLWPGEHRQPRSLLGYLIIDVIVTKNCVLLAILTSVGPPWLSGSGRLHGSDGVHLGLLHR